MSGIDQAPPDPDRLRPWSRPGEEAESAPDRIEVGGPETSAPSEPTLNLPAAPAALAGATLLAFALQSATGVEAGAVRFGFQPASLSHAGAWSRLITVDFVHGGWAHVAMNTLGLVAFGAPVARLFGRGGGGAVAFLAFYFACGALACLGYGAMHQASGVLMVGASGAVSGLMGAASRLIGLHPGARAVRLAPMLSAPVLGMAGAWIAVNALIALTGVSPGAGGAPVAWEAHLFGYAAGLLLVWPVARALGGVRG